jgi:hypothetical protein
MARNAMAIAAHTPYSPDLSPSDFYLFGHMKGWLKRESFETGERFLSAVENFLKCKEERGCTTVLGRLIHSEEPLPDSKHQQ